MTLLSLVKKYVNVADEAKDSSETGEPAKFNKLNRTFSFTTKLLLENVQCKVKSL